jgi:tetratricopeptide (TPR) repeat protein
MNFDDSKESKLANWLRNKSAVLFCGAGISLDPPASLPGWKELRDYTLKVIADVDPFLTNYYKYLQSLETISERKKSLSPEVVMSKIKDDLYENLAHYVAYFDSLKQHFGEGQLKPNINHLYLAKLAKAKAIKYILTTNFDTFIEKALEQEGVACKVCCTDEEFAQFLRHATYKDNFVYLLKLHGCIKHHDSIVVTIEQEARGMSVNKKSALIKLFSQYYVVFLGYSGADLKIDTNYLQLITMKEAGKGFLWYFLSSEDVSSQVQELVKQYTIPDKAEIRYGKLPDLFDNIISPLDQIKPRYTEGEKEKRRAEQNEQVLKSLTEWAKQYMNTAQACNMFGCLLSRLVEMEKAEQCFQRVLAPLGEKADQEYLLVAYNNIGSIYEQREKHQEALEYYQKVLAFSQRKKYLKGEAVAFSNMGRIYHCLAQYDEAISCCKASAVIDEKLGNHKGLCNNWNTMGTSYQAKKKYSKALKYLSKAQKKAEKIGSVDELAASLHQLGKFLVEQKKYIKALALLEKAKEKNKSIGDIDRLTYCLRAIGDVYLLEALDLKTDRASRSAAFQQAETTFQEAEEIDMKMGYQHNIVWDILHKADLFLKQCLFEKAQQSCDKAIIISDELQFDSGKADAFTMKGNIYCQQCQCQMTISFWRQAKELYQKLGKTKTVADLEQKISQLESQSSKQQICSQPAIGRNDPCPCKSGKKYKNCCRNSDELKPNN